jgi:xylose isomerase
MDTFARGLLAAARLEEEGTFQAWRDERYASWKGELGQKIVSGQVTFAELEQFALQAGEPKQISAKQEKYEMLLNRYV